MNPHIEDTQSSIVASNDGVFGLTERQIMAAQAQAQAALALAYEQRTALLMAERNYMVSIPEDEQGDGWLDLFDSLQGQINERLGLA